MIGAEDIERIDLAKRRHDRPPRRCGPILRQCW
jgi:hypothetical protein